MDLDGITIGVELVSVLRLFGEGVEVGCVLGSMHVFGELVDPVDGCVLRVDVGTLVLDALTQVEDVVKQSRTKDDDEQVGDDHLPARPAPAGVFVLAFLRHDGAKIELFPKFAANSVVGYLKSTYGSEVKNNVVNSKPLLYEQKEVIVSARFGGCGVVPAASQQFPRGY